MLLAVVTAEPWQWRPHPEVWLLVASIAALGIYVDRVLARHAGETVTRRQRLWFGLGLVLLWLASDWPLHDIAEQYLYSAHMVQHFLLTMVIPPVFWMATPRWLARAVVAPGQPGWGLLRRATNPIVITVVFNSLVLVTHWPTVVNASVSGPAVVHYSVHLAMVTAAFALWAPVCGPWAELQLSAPGKMIFLFVQSIVPTVPGAWLTLAENAVYTVYDREPRLWGIDVTSDQTTAGLIMKVLGGSYLWAVIATMFFRWSLSQEKAQQGRIVTVDEDGTVHDVEPPLTPSETRVPPPRA